MKNSLITFTSIGAFLLTTACNEPNKEVKMEDEAHQLLEEMDEKESIEKTHPPLNEVKNTDSSAVEH